MSLDPLWLPDGNDVFLDIVGACNLSCPSCGQGNSRGARRFRGVMQLPLFERILDKVEAEAPGPGRPRIHLFNWGEPLLHPRAPDFVRAVKARGLVCRLSSNLVRPRDLRAVVEARPDWLRVSVSGFWQSTYGVTHRGGDVARVKDNLRTLRRLMDELGVPLHVDVNYHRYRHNCAEDLVAMRNLVEELRFSFTPVWAIPAPVEKVVRWLEEGVPPQDQPLVDLLVIGLEEAREISLRHAGELPAGECPLGRMVLIGADGSAELCCATYDVEPVATSYLEVPAPEIAARKLRHPACGPCMRNGLHLTGLYAGMAERDARAAAVLEAQFAALPSAPAASTA
ncbi:MAG: radical SAM protein [Deltaproteobacteria bacterium]|nr:radical SAM protein [Deltaproteobacteria bacterium]